jgi:uncharacterized RDD family membrane protein YckC
VAELEQPDGEQRANAPDVALGLAVTAARLARISLRAPLLRRGGDHFASAGRDAREQALVQLETAAEQALTDPQVEQAIERIVQRLLESHALEQVADQILRSPQFQHMIEEVVTSPAVRAALLSQTTAARDDLMAAIRRRAARLDAAVEGRVRAWLRRPARPLTPYGGIVTRGIALVTDIALAQIGFLAGAAVVAIIASLVGGLRPDWLASTIAGVGWALAVGAYFVGFWTLVGQTPGMRAMRVRVRGSDGEPPGLGHSLLRLVGLVLAIIPFGAGFIPVLFDGRRRGLQDFLGGTVVLYDGGSFAVGEAASPVASGLSAS